jgi:N-acyl-D-amino-acid deacylase
LVVDGTGAAARRTDVVVDGPRIRSVGDVPSDVVSGAEVVDLDGLVLSPGFVDPHTHYDAQVLWDPDLTPSSWHGVTSVLMGNCGIGVAPIRDDQHETIIHALASVEGMTVETLREGIGWGFESFPEYLSAIESVPTRLNVAALVGHSPLRLAVMGEASLTDVASDEQLAALRQAMDEAMAAGAFGFSTSRSGLHSTSDGSPVPSRVAAQAEMDLLFGAVRDAGHGLIEAALGPDLTMQDLTELAAATGRPVTSAGFVSEVSRGNGPALLESFRVGNLPGHPGLPDAGGRFWPQVPCRPVVVQLSLVEPFPLAPLASFKEVVSRPKGERASVYADRAWRDRARPEVAGSPHVRMEKVFVAESVRHAELIGGPSLAVLAAERGVDAFDLMVQLALDEDLETRFLIIVSNDTERRLAEMLKEPQVLLGLGDAGAHADMLCDACYPPPLLGHWYREKGTLSVEDAVWRLTGHPAAILGLTDRGRIAPGWAGDLVAFDPTTVGTLDMERVWDLPAGADRLLAKAAGIERVWVNGEVVHRAGTDVEGVRPGTVLRSSR